MNLASDKAKATDTEASSTRSTSILRSAVLVFGTFGYKKTSVDDLAAAAGLSKQGLYLHFPSKNAIFSAAIELYLEEGLAHIRAILNDDDVPLKDRIIEAMDAWFGRHIVTFTYKPLDVITAGNTLSPVGTEAYKTAFQSALTKAIARERRQGNIKLGISPAELAKVLFLFGLSWREDGQSRNEFRKNVELMATACFPPAQ